MPAPKDFHIDPNALPANADLPAAGTTPIVDDNFAAKVARESMMADRAGAAAMRPPTRVDPDLSKVEALPAPPKPVITEAERTQIMEQVKKRRGRPSKVATPTPAPAVDVFEKILGGKHSLQDCARTIIAHFRTLSADWGNKITALKEERSLDDLHACISLIAYALDADQHLVMPVDHPSFQGGLQPAGTNFDCVICAKPQSRMYAGQPPLCSAAGSPCPGKFHALSQEDQNELLGAG